MTLLMLNPNSPLYTLFIPGSNFQHVFGPAELSVQTPQVACAIDRNILEKSAAHILVAVGKSCGHLVLLQINSVPWP